MCSVIFLLLPVLAFAQARGPVIKRTNPPTLATPNGYTHVVEVAGPSKTIYIAGQVALDQARNVVGKDVKTQAEQVFKNLQAALTAAGAKFSDVVKVTMFTTDISQVAAIRDVRSRYFGDSAPASTLVEVSKLAQPDFLIEVEAIAVVAQ